MMGCISFGNPYIFIRNLFRNFSEELREHFSTYGDIESINVKTDPNTGRSRGFAFIVFAKAEALDKVIFIFSCNNNKMKSFFLMV